MIAWPELGTGEALTRLAIARGSLLDEVIGEVYLDSLADLEPGLVTRACAALALEPRAEYEPALPPVGTIRARVGVLAREDADRASRAKLLPAPTREQDEPTFFCTDCQDEPAAWRLFFCQGSGPHQIAEKPAKWARVTLMTCGRTEPHAPHPYADRCHCSDTNPVIAAHRRRQEEFRKRKAAK